MTWEQRIVVFRFWIAERPGILGIPVALLFIGVLVATVLVLRPGGSGPATEIGGRIVAEAPSPDAQDYNVARVVVELTDGSRFTTATPLTQTCRVGDQAVVARYGAGRGHRLLSCRKG